MLQGNILVAQGGGPTAVINQSLVGIVLEARKYKSVENVYGALNGVSGIISEEFINLSHETAGNLELVAQTPSSALGSTRDKPDEDYCKKIFESLKAHNIQTFFYIGGNDSSDTLRILANEARTLSYPLRCIHIPKTIDNDLTVNDHTPGYSSAAKFVSNAFAGVNLDNRALKGVYIGVVMGRHAGFLTAASALGRKFVDDGPHLIYLPEREFSLKKFTNDIERIYSNLGRCVVAISEGIHDADGKLIISQLAQKMETDAHGNLQLSGTGELADLLTNVIKSKTNISRVRGDTFGYLQRSFLSCVSEVDQLEAREVAILGVQFANNLGRDGSVTIHRTGDYKIEYRLSPLEDVAGKTKVMEDRFISNCATDVTPSFLEYLRPIVGVNMMEIGRLEAPVISKVLKKMNID
jgi:6-phosphofructokinase 1